MHWASNRLRWGEHRGGMYRGDRGRARRRAGNVRSWHMIAEGDDGPFIPVDGLRGDHPQLSCRQTPCAGRAAATGDLELEDYERLFARRAIHTGHARRRLPASTAALSPPARRELTTRCPRRCRRCMICDDRHDRRRHRHGDARRIGCSRGSRRRWSAFRTRARTCRCASISSSRTAASAGRAHSRAARFTARRSRGAGASNGWCASASVRSASAWRWCSTTGRLRLIVRRCSVFGIPLPLWLAPRGDSYEYAENGRFHFHVEIAHPFTGLIVGYRGWLVPRA